MYLKKEEKKENQKNAWEVLSRLQFVAKTFIVLFMDMDIFFNEPNYLRHQKLIGMYQKYRLDMTENHAQFFIVYKCFLDVLKNIKNSLKLFLYCGLNADYSTGCLPINDFAVIVKDLGVGSRTIYNWINELSAQGVIAYRDEYNG